jgi:hypothetical protein
MLARRDPPFGSTQQRFSNEHDFDLLDAGPPMFSHARWIAIVEPKFCAGQMIATTSETRDSQRHNVEFSYEIVRKFNRFFTEVVVAPTLLDRLTNHLKSIYLQGRYVGVSRRQT